MLPAPPPPSQGGATSANYSAEGQRYISAQDVTKIAQNSLARKSEHKPLTEVELKQTSQQPNKTLHKQPSAPPGGSLHHPLKEVGQLLFFQLLVAY